MHDEPDLAPGSDQPPGVEKVQHILEVIAEGRVADDDIGPLVIVQEISPDQVVVFSEQLASERVIQLDDAQLIVRKPVAEIVGDIPLTGGWFEQNITWSDGETGHQLLNERQRRGEVVIGRCDNDHEILLCD